MFSELACSEHNVREAVDVEGPKMKNELKLNNFLSLGFYVKFGKLDTVIFVLLRFYVKSILGILEVQKLPFLLF